MKLAAQATTQAEAEAVAQGDESAVAVNAAKYSNGGSTDDPSHIAKKQAVGSGVDGTPKASATRVDAHEQTPKEDRAKFASFSEMEFDEEKNNARSRAEMFRGTEIMQQQHPDQMQCLCINVKQKCVLGWMKDSRQMVQDDLVTMKEDVRQIKLGSSSTVCSDASTAEGKGPSGTFTRPPPGIGNRSNEWFFYQGRLNSMGWLTDYKTM